ncbi:MAG: alpha/beta hydrolase [Dermatophilaceae bacterium]
MESVSLRTGITLRYLRQGDPSGVPVVLLHAWADTLRFFEPLLPLLPAWLHTLVPTQRGHGEADKPAAGYALQDFSEDVAAFLDALNIAAAVIVGHSSGGYVAQRFALDHPDRVLGLVLVGSPKSLHGLRPSFTEAVESLRDPIDADTVRTIMSAMPLFQPVPEAFVDAMTSESAKVPAHVWKSTFAGLIAAEPPTETGTITTPTLILWGESDQLLPRHEQEALVAAIPGSVLVAYEGTGHLVLWEQPARVASDLTSFVSRLKGPGGSPVHEPAR